MNTLSNSSNTEANPYRLAFVVSMGGMLEIYNFIVYAVMTPYIADNFFPFDNPTASFLGAFATFFVGYISRLLGGIYFGYLGDRYGRKNTFILTVSIMAGTTALIGLLPPYHIVGIISPILLVLLRLLQGFAIGGELPGTMTYLVETLPNRKGLIVSVLFMSLLIGLSLASFIHEVIMINISVESMRTWGWRLPFIIGGILGFISYFFRKFCNETTAFLTLDSNQQRASMPIYHLFQSHLRGFICGLAITTIFGSVIGTIVIFMPQYLNTLYGLNQFKTNWQISIALTIFAPSCLLYGFLTDRLPHKLVFFLAIILIISIIVPYYHYILSNHYELTSIMLVAGMISALVSGTLPPLLMSLFPTEIRYTGIAAVYNIGMTVFSGFSPIIITSLSELTGFQVSPMVYLIIIALVSSSVLFMTWPTHQIRLFIKKIPETTHALTINKHRPKPKTPTNNSGYKHANSTDKC